MAKIYIKPTVQWYKDQIGYSSGSSKSSKYSKELDGVSFYNTRKNGYTNWCAIFDDCGIYENAEPNSNINDVRALVFEPNKDNCGAGCAQKIDYFKRAGAWYQHKAKGCPAQIGDQIFFGSSSYKSSSNPLGAYHTGVVIDWDSKGLYTAEGNTNGKGDVSKRFYSYGDSRILGFGRPAWTGVEPPKEEKPEPVPAPEPTPEPVPEKPIENKKSIEELAKEVINGKWGNGADRAKKLKAAGYDYDAVQKRVNEILGISKPATSSGKTYTVRVNSKLNVRGGAGTNNRIIRQLSNGTKVTVYEQKDGWGRIGNGEWVSMAYLK